MRSFDLYRESAHVTLPSENPSSSPDVREFSAEVTVDPAGLVSCAAILAVRNEAIHIARILDDFILQGIDVVVIDNDSSDETVPICEQFLGRGLLRIENLPWSGTFDLTAQLIAKERICRGLAHDWVIHTDADEWMHSPIEGESLLEAISRVSNAGFNAINFEEFAFIPDGNENSIPDNYQRTTLNYYYFSPGRTRLMRAWRRDAGFSNLDSGGHLLDGSNVRLAPEPFILRHYIVLSYEHAVRKYVDREFAEADVLKGWHFDRLDISGCKLKLPDVRHMKRLAHWQSMSFDRSDPKQSHYWKW